MKNLTHNNCLRVFPSRTKLTPIDSNVRFHGPELFDDCSMPVRISCTFSWDKPRAEWLYNQWAHFKDVELGGPAYDDPGGEFTPGLFIREGAIFTSRGCSQICKPCFVPEREGYLRELEVVHEGYNVLDNDFLGCSEPHLDQCFKIFSRSSKQVHFTGGLNAELLCEDHLERFAAIRCGDLWFACDTDAALEPLRKASKMLTSAGFMSIEKRRCYALIIPQLTTLAKAEKRLKQIYAYGFLPMAMLYRGPEAVKRKSGDHWDKFVRYWAKPPIYRANEIKPVIAKEKKPIEWSCPPS